MENQEFNGYTNWDTWNASLWLNNREWMYKDCLHLVKHVIDADTGGELIKDYVQQINLTGDGFDSQQVNWEEVANTFLEE